MLRSYCQPGPSRLKQGLRKLYNVCSGTSLRQTPLGPMYSSGPNLEVNNLYNISGAVDWRAEQPGKILLIDTHDMHIFGHFSHSIRVLQMQGTCILLVV